jgi:hypothetical protein
MQSNKKEMNPTPAPIYRVIKQTSETQGQIGEAAINAAARHQLHRYARDIEDYVESSRMDALLNQLQAAIDLDEVHRRG